MQFSKVGPFLSVSRITGPKHNILQLEISNGDGTLALVERLGIAGPTSLSEDKVVCAVLEGVTAANDRFQRNYAVTRVRYAPRDSGPEAVYTHLAFSIIANLEAGGYGEAASSLLHVGSFMEVIDHGPQAWFLLRDGDALLLDVRCSHSAVDYSVLIELDTAERAEYSARGHAFLNELAEAIHLSAPGLRSSTSPYKSRNLSSSRGDVVGAAVAAWSIGRG